MLPDQFDTLQMKEFYTLLNACLDKQKQNDIKASYYTTWMLASFCGAKFDFVKVWKCIYEGLYPDENKPTQEGKDEFMKQFNL